MYIYTWKGSSGSLVSAYFLSPRHSSGRFLSCFLHVSLPFPQFLLKQIHKLKGMKCWLNREPEVSQHVYRTNCLRTQRPGKAQAGEGAR